MKRTIFLVAVVSLAGCSALGIGQSTLDRTAAAQNLANVQQIAVENAELNVKAGEPPVSQAASKQRNDAAVLLAEKMATDAAR